jgi:hypothetical protein
LKQTASLEKSKRPHARVINQIMGKGRKGKRRKFDRTACQRRRRKIQFSFVGTKCVNEKMKKNCAFASKVWEKQNQKKKQNKEFFSIFFYRIFL